MKLTKYVHSCILYESVGLRVLLDPGSFARKSHLLPVKKLESLDYIVLTHEHGDHYDESLLRSLAERQPHAVIVTNDDLAEKIKQLNLPNPIQVGSDEIVTVFEAAHEPLPLGMPNVRNIGVHIGDKFTHPGDSFAFSHTREVLALPMTGPWGSLKDALGKVVKLKPKIVIPVHDWEWHKAAREVRYAMSKKLLEPHNIDFIEPENATPLSFKL